MRSIKPSHDEQFDAHMYGNALQMFIRTPDGNAIVGSYRVTYDYDPKTLKIRRDVALVKAGGVDPNRKGAANEMMDIAKNNQERRRRACTAGRRPPPRACAVSPTSST